MISLSLILLFFFKNRSTTESTWSVWTSILLFFKEMNEGEHMISLSLILLLVFFITERRTTESTWSACPSILLYFKEKNVGNHMISLSLILLFFSKTEERRKAHDQFDLPYYYFSKKRMRESYDQSLPYTIVVVFFYNRKKNDGKHMISLSFHNIIFQRKE